jgi:uncharacterized damage-inducible protein DinB
MLIGLMPKIGLPPYLVAIMTIGESLAAELQEEAANTLKILSRIPEQELGWQPHPKSMTLGRLGMHIAELPNWMIACLQSDHVDFGKPVFQSVIPNTCEEIMEVFHKTLDQATNLLETATNTQLNARWQFLNQGQLLFEMPRVQVIRRELNHIIHHRGQLTVFLRLLDIPAPGMFGPSADE